MPKKVMIFIAVLVLGLGFALYQILVVNQKSDGALKVEASPESSVFLNDRLVGKTPVDMRYPAGDYVIKIIPEGGSDSISSWQGKAVVKPSLLTYVKRELGASELTSAGELVTLEKISDSDAQIEVNSTPESAKILLDGQEKGVTPLLLKDISATEHDISVMAVGFFGRTVRIQATPGYKVNVLFQLSLSDNKEQPSQQATPSASVATPSSEIKQSTASVIIKDTPTGFLRVRNDASTNAREVAQVKPGQKFPLVEEKNGWYRITYEEGKDGWISTRYATKSE